MAAASGEGFDSRRYALKFISGKYQGGMFPLRPDKEIVIGRSSDLDMVLVEDMVSRKHAKITTGDNKIAIQDLGSTNGTFVNGEKVKKTRLKEGDRILIGTSILKVVAIEATSEKQVPPSEGEARSMMERANARQPKASSPMSGHIEEVPLPDLLQLFSTSKKSGIMIVRREGQEGRIYMRQGRIYYVAIDNRHEMGPQKAFSRMIAWEDGFFELTGPSEESFPVELDESTEGLLMDAMREIDEIKRFEDQIPPWNSKLRIPSPLLSPLSELEASQLDCFQLVLNEGVLQQVLDKSLPSDLDTLQAIHHLLKKGYIEKV